MPVSGRGPQWTHRFSMRSLFSAVAVALVAAADGRGAWAADLDGPFAIHSHVGVVSNYVSRGLTQTWGKPAAQAEVEIEHDSGLYAGTFVSNVSSNQFPGGNVEVDVWAGYEHELGNDFTVSVEGYGYFYPGANYSHGSCDRGVVRDPVVQYVRGSRRGPLAMAQHEVRLLLHELLWRLAADRLSVEHEGDLVLGRRCRLPSARRRKLASRRTSRVHAIQRAIRLSGPAVVQDPSYWDWRLGATKSIRNAPGTLRIGGFYSESSNRAFYGSVPSLTGGGTRNLGRAAFVVEINQTF